jgi:phospholipase/lecithinase/hemolysin
MGKKHISGKGALLSAVSALAGLLFAGSAGALPYPTIYAFGDSLSDAGNIYYYTSNFLKPAQPVSPPYSAGRFSNGPVWVQDLSVAAGLGTLKASLTGGTDYAFGGATTGQSSVHTGNQTDLPSQLSMFTGKVPKPNAASLFTLWIGSNDLIAVLAAGGNAAATTTAVNQILANEATFVTGLAKAGAKHLLVITVPDLGLAPEITAKGAAASKAGTALAKRYNAALTAKLKLLATADKLDIKIFDPVALLEAAVAHPATYGFTNVKSPCWSGNFTSATSGKVCASSLTGQDKYLFWDQLHPTAAGHSAIAQQVETLLGIKPSLVASN